jgi:hypothetical protein
MSSPEPHIETTPPWLEPVPPAPPMTRRRKVLLVVVGLLAVAIVVVVFALNAVLEARLPKSAAATDSGSSASDITDCSSVDAKWIGDWVTSQKAPIAQAYGSTVTGAAGPWQTPDDFPVAAFAWAQTVPACGSIIQLSDHKTIWQYRLDVDTATRTQFDGISTMLSAMGYLMVADQVPLDQIGQDNTSGAAPTPAATGDPTAPDTPTNLYREFSAPRGNGDLWMTLFTTDLKSDTASGELLIGFTNVG